MNSDTDRRLEVVLDREIETARTLATTLQSERAALTGGSPEAVIETAAEKTALFGTMERLDAERRQLCDAADITLPARQRHGTPAAAGVSPPVAERWHALLEVIASCRIANDVNGYIINARRGQVSQLLQILRGGTPVTYGPHGKTLANSLRALARA